MTGYTRGVSSPHNGPFKVYVLRDDTNAINETLNASLRLRAHAYLWKLVLTSVKLKRQLFTWAHRVYQ